MATTIIRPNAVGDYTTLLGASPHWAQVDDVIPDEDATYVHLYHWVVGTTGYDSYNLSDVGFGAATITNVQIIGRFRRIAQNPAGSGLVSFGLGVRTNGANSWTAENTRNNSYFNASRNYAINPVTGLAWTLAEINALQVYLWMQFINRALADGGLMSTRCTQVYAVITGSFAPTVQTDPATEIT